MSLINARARIERILSNEDALISVPLHTYQGIILSKTYLALEHIIMDDGSPKEKQSAKKITNIADILKVGDNLFVECVVHAVPQTENNYNVHITKALIFKIETPKFIQGFQNCIGRVQSLTDVDGVLLYIDEDIGREYRIYFPTINMYVEQSKIVDTITDLKDTVLIGTELNFDAVPVLPQFNPHQCEFIATRVWIGLKPIQKILFHRNINLLDDISILSMDPEGCFLRSYGTIISLKDNYGIILGQLNKNRWASIVFHNSSVFCTNVQKGQESNIRRVFNKGDKVDFLAVKLNVSLPMQWAAIQVSVIDKNADQDALIK